MLGFTFRPCVLFKGHPAECCLCVLSVLPGGTDIVSCFMGQNPTVPVHRGEIQTRNLGMAVEAWGLDGKKCLAVGDCRFILSSTMKPR